MKIENSVKATVFSPSLLLPNKKSNHNLSVLRSERKRQERKRGESQNIVDEF